MGVLQAIGAFIGTRATVAGDLAAAGSGLRSLGGAAMHAGFNAALQEGTMPWSREMRYQANNTAANLVPDPQSILRVYLAGEISAALAQQLMAYHGIDWIPDVGAQSLTNTEYAWRKILKISETKHSPDAYLQWVRQGRAQPGQLSEALRWAGFKNPADRALFEEQYNSLEVATITHLYSTGRITRPQAFGRLKELGYRDEEADLIIDAVGYGYTLPELAALKMRGVITRQQFLDQAQFLGLRDDQAKEWSEEFLKTYPTVSDLILFSTREVWDNQVVNRFGYDREFPPELEHWGGKLGLAWGEGFETAAGDVVPAVPWTRAHWRAHWHVLAPGQAFQAYHRFRPSAADPAMSVVPGVATFTRDDVESMLKIQDYAPGVRDWLLGLSYRVNRLIDIRKALRIGVRERPWAVSQFLDRGHSPPDAEFLADLTMKEREKEENAALEKWRKARKGNFLKAAIRAYKIGYLGRPLFKSNLLDMGFTEEETEQVIGLIDYELQTDTVDEVIKRTKSDYMSGKTTADEARARMVQIGVAEYFADNYLLRWKYARGERYTLATTAKLLDWFKRGLLNEEEVRRRFKNLGWSDADTLIYLEAARQDLAKIEAKEKVIEEKTVQAQAKELERLTREAQRNLEKLQAKLRLTTPVATLKAWLKKGIIGRAEFLNRLAAMGYEIGVAEKHAEEAGDGLEATEVGEPGESAPGQNGQVDGETQEGG